MHAHMNNDTKQLNKLFRDNKKIKFTKRYMSLSWSVCLPVRLPICQHHWLSVCLPRFPFIKLILFYEILVVVYTKNT